MTKRRIWELDALRGLCILGMLVFHLLYDVTELYGLVDWQLPSWLTGVAGLGATVFLLLSGLCVTLGSRPVRRGLTVFACGMLCTLVTWVIDSDLTIRFGMLHCLGVCMVLWPLFRKIPTWALGVSGAVILALGWYIDACNVRTGLIWLFPLGILYPGFSSGDFYPLLPNLGWFLLGAVIGRTLYRKKTSLAKGHTPFLELCGRHSLLIYLLHQPLFAGLLELLTRLELV